MRMRYKFTLYSLTYLNTSTLMLSASALECVWPDDVTLTRDVVIIIAVG